MTERRERLARMRAAAVEARAAVRQLREALVATERELTIERKHLADAERRGRLAAAISDTETVRVAEQFVGRHGERVRVLERKLEAQRAELVLADRDVADMVAQLQALDGGSGGADVGAGPAADPDADTLLRFKLDQAAKESAAEEMLKALKKRMGKE